MKKILMFLIFVLFLTSCTITVGDTYNCDGDCCDVGKNLKQASDTTHSETETYEEEYEVVEEETEESEE